MLPLLAMLMAVLLLLLLLLLIVHAVAVPLAAAMERAAVGVTAACHQ
jgi:hypothetical protein